MNSITIEVPGEELETISVALTSEEVKSIYLQRKQLQVQLQELEKKLKTEEQNNKYNAEARNEAEKELKNAHTLLTALNVPEKTKEEESWRETKLEMSTRIALYIAGKTN